MYLAQVIGAVVASEKVDGLCGQKLLVVQPLDAAQKPIKNPEVAVDTVQAGEGDLVTCVGSREAALALAPSFVPVDAAIIGVVSQADVGDGPPAPKARAKPPSPAAKKGGQA